MKQQFSEALRGKKIPILTLDNKWYKLLDEETRKTVSGTEEKLNQLLKRQGKLNTETRDIKKLKKAVQRNPSNRPWLKRKSWLGLLKIRKKEKQ